MRLDRLCAELNIGSRSDVKKLIRNGKIAVDGEIVKSPELQVDEKSAVISCGGRTFKYAGLMYFMLNKPAGVVSATSDASERTVTDLLREQFPDVNTKDIFPAGRLDKDTVGLLLLTNDGELSHRLLSPKKHVDKTYLVRLGSDLSPENAARIEAGVDIGEDRPTLPARIDAISPTECRITIHEGKFHQVKRMFAAVGCEVIYLKRLSMGPLVLDDALPEGRIRRLSDEEISLLTPQ